MRHSSMLLMVAATFCCASAGAQTPGVLYTFAGTGNVRDWAATSENNVNATTILNGSDGELTITELGDPILGDPGGTITIRDGFNRVRESSTVQGGLDVTGLDAIEIDLSRTGSGDVQVQFFVQARPSFDFVTFASTFYTIGPGDHTLSFPVSMLTPAQQAYIRTIGLKVFEHSAAGNITWTIKETRSVGTPLTTRVLATHDLGSIDDGLNGVIANFDRTAIAGNDGGQNQTGFTVNPNGSLQWTDLGGQQGAALGWGNGTTLSFNGGSPNTFNERPTDVSNYTHVTFRMSATDPLNVGGSLGVQGYFQTGSAFTYQVAGEAALSIDGQFHDVTFPLAAITDRQHTQLAGFNLFAHATDLVINVDQVTFTTQVGLPGDYNTDGKVNAADYVVWRDRLNSSTALPNEGASTGVVDQADYDFWKAQFGAGSGSGAAAAAVPEPTGLLLSVCGLVLGVARRRKP